MVVVLFVAVGVNWMGDDVVALLLVAEKLLQADDGADDQGDLSNGESLQGEEGQTAKSDGDEGGSLQFQEQQDWEERFHDFLLLAASCNEIQISLLQTTWMNVETTMSFVSRSSR